MKITIYLSTIFLFFLITSTNLKAQKTQPAEKILSEAYQKAAKEKKNVLVVFKASWCIWCKKMTSSIKDKSCNNSFEKNYVIVELTVDESDDKKNLENAGADEVRKKFHGEQAGLPFWVILDKDGKLLDDSYMRKEGESINTPGENIGCPAAEEEVAAFCEKLKKTSNLSDTEISIIADRFKKNH
jgi:thioredoxin-related protein